MWYTRSNPGIFRLLIYFNCWSSDWRICFIFWIILIFYGIFDYLWKNSKMAPNQHLSVPTIPSKPIHNYEVSGFKFLLNNLWKFLIFNFKSGFYGKCKFLIKLAQKNGLMVFVKWKVEWLTNISINFRFLSH